MPLKPLFESEGRRTAVIAAAMIVLLLAALAGAFAYTRMSSIRVVDSVTAVNLEQLHLDLPGQWSPAPGGNAAGNVARVLRFNDKAGRRITVAALPPLRGRAADSPDGWYIALAMAGPLLDPRLVSHPSSITPSKLDDLPAVRIAGLFAEAGKWMDHEAVLLSHDGQHYWLVYLVSPVGQRGGGQPERLADKEFLQRVLESVRIDGPTTRPGAETSNPDDPGDPR